MSPIQSNTREGLVKLLVSTATLVDKEGYLAKLVNGTGPATVELCGAADIAQFVITEGAAVDAYAELQPLYAGRNVRVICATTIAGGVKVAPSSAGKIQAAVTGQHVIGILEEDAVNTQYALVRPTGPSVMHAATAVALTATNPTAPAAYSAVTNMTDPVTKAEGEAVSAALAALRGTVATNETAISALVVDVAAIKAVLDAHLITS